MFSARGGFFASLSQATTTYLIALTRSQYSSAIKSDSSLWIWGYNTYGQLGTNDVVRRSLPVQIGTSSWSQIGSIGDDATLGITTTGRMFAWGLGSNGELGTNTTINRSSPTQIGTATNWRYIATSNRNSAANAGAINTLGQLFAWGRNDFGQLGTNGTTVTRSSPVQVAGSWTMANIGRYQSGGIKSDGTLWVWGYNATRQLADGTSINRSSPVQILSGYTFSEVAMFDNNDQASGGGVGITTDSTVWVWGDNNYGALATGDTVDRSSPVQLPGSWTTISISSQRGYGIRTDDTLWGWGRNDGFLGINANLSWTQVSSGSQHTLGVRSDGSLWAWGNGQALGINQSFDTRSIPVQIGSDSWNQVSAGNQSSYAIKNDGSLWAWGLNSSGQLGLNSTISRSSPVQISTNSWSNITASKQGNFVLGITNDNGLYGWGDNTNGILGLGIKDNSNRSNPTQITNGIPYNVEFTTGNYLTIAGSSEFAFGTGDFTIECWFYPTSTAGVIWDTRTSLSGGPNIELYYTNINYGYPSVQYYYSGTDRIHSSELTLNTWYHVALVRISGTTKMYLNGVQTGSNYTDSTNYNQTNNVYIGQGHDSSSQYTGSISNLRVNKGNGLYSNTFTPNRFLTNVAGTVLLTCQSSTIIDNSNNSFNITQNGTLTVTGNTETPTLFAQVSAGTSHSLVLDSTNMLYAWGETSSGQTGSTNTGISWTTIAQKYVSGVNGAIRDDGSLWLWGYNGFGGLGNNDTINRSSPIQVGTNSWSQIALSDTTLAIRTDGTLWGWGDNSAGTLGLNDRVYRSSPVQIGTDTWNSIKCGGNISAGIKSNGTLWTWGTNNSGQLGTNDTITRSSPVQVGTGSWLQISAGSGMAGIDINNKLYTWGSNLSGQLCIGTTTNRSSPVQVGTSNWTMVVLANQVFAGIKSDSTLWTCGGGLYLGNGSTNLQGRSSPIQIGTSSWTFIGGGSNTIGAITISNALWAWGTNGNGSLGDGTTVNKSSMVSIAGTYLKASIDSTQASLLLSSTYLIKSTGSNLYGSLGLNSTINRSSPVQVGTVAPYPMMVGASSWTQISAGASFSMAIKSDNTLFAWGANDNGQLGLSSTINRSSPVQVGTSSWTSISAGSNHCVGIEADNSVMAWGLNTSGQTAYFNLSNTATRSSPVQISSFNSPNLPSNVSVVAGTLSSFYVDRIGQLWSWGDNSFYQLGTLTAGGFGASIGIPGFVDNLSYITSPIQISSLSWHSVYATTYDSNPVYYGQTGGIGVTKADPLINPENDNILYIWGMNYQGSTVYGRNGTGNLFAVEPSPVVVTLA